MPSAKPLNVLSGHGIPLVSGYPLSPRSLLLALAESSRCSLPQMFFPTTAAMSHFHYFPVFALLLAITANFPVHPPFESRLYRINLRPRELGDDCAFYLVNYGAHAATVIVLPGGRDHISHFGVILALLFPYSGTIRAGYSISIAGPRFRDPLRRALYAGTLCEVIPDRDNYGFGPTDKKIHGRATIYIIGASNPLWGYN